MTTARFEDPVLDTTKFNLKYVVSFSRTQQKFFVDVTRDWKYHSDCAVPAGYKEMSAGWVSIPLDEFKANDFTNLETWGGSVGLQIGTHPRDAAMLKMFLDGESCVFDKDGKPASSL